jgi:hypothetical protein
MFNIKILQKEDQSILKNLFVKNPQVFNGYTDHQYQDYLIQSTETMLNDKLFFNVGIFNKNNLVGAIILKEFSTAPAWCWAHHLFENRGFLINNTEMIDMFKDIDQIIFDEMENKRKLNRWHFAYNAEHLGVRSIGGIDRLLRFSKNFKKDYNLSKYHYITEHVLESNSIPKYDYQKNMILNRSWPIRIGFRTAFKIED